jgi:hypothetical protein
MDQTKLELLDAHDWQPTITRLVAYVVMLCRLHQYKLPGQTQPEDVVVEAIEKVYGGERNWDPEKDKDLGRYMASVVKSMMSNLMESKQLRTVDVNSVTIPISESVHPQLEYEELNNRIVESVRKDPELAIVFKALKDGFRPIDISREYSLDIEIVRSAQKKLRTLVTRIIEES